jgi:2-keto-4-pentenoate hydratase/2-oxohepta-3-ene-1,7-dioic acid hydratase in catechol pathway
MKVVRIETPAGPRYAYLLSDGQLELLSAAPWNAGIRTGEPFASSAATLVPVEPSKIVCVGRNYGAHARELGNQVPDEPLLFLKPTSALVGPGAPIELPSMSQRVEHEAELGIVIGKHLKRATAEEVRGAIAGITCVNDVTARDIQRKEVQFTRAKSFDSFCPVGPHVETELPDLTDIAVSARVNGELRQHGNTKDMVFPVLELIAFISQVMTLLPGDLISTGTPEGVGPLTLGDTVEIEVGGVGVLRNVVR